MLRAQEGARIEPAALHVIGRHARVMDQRQVRLAHAEVPWFHPAAGNIT